MQHSIGLLFVLNLSVNATKIKQWLRVRLCRVLRNLQLQFGTLCVVWVEGNLFGAIQHARNNSQCYWLKRREKLHSQQILNKCPSNRILIYHFEACKWEVSQCSSVEYLIPFVEIVYRDLRDRDYLFPLLLYIVYSFGYLVIECDGLGLLDITQGGHIKQHPVHIIGITSDLSKQTGFKLSGLNIDLNLRWYHLRFAATKAAQLNGNGREWQALLEYYVLCSRRRYSFSLNLSLSKADDLNTWKHLFKGIFPADHLVSLLTNYAWCLLVFTIHHPSKC